MPVLGAWCVPRRYQPGDIVAVRHGIKGRQEGLVIGSYFDYAVRPSTALFFKFSELNYYFHIQGRQIIEVQLEGELFHAW